MSVAALQYVDHGFLCAHGAGGHHPLWPPEIFNTDHGCQFTNQEFTGLLQTHGIQIGMDGAGRRRANVFVGRLWRSFKYEVVSLYAYETVRDAQDGVARCMTFYNQIRPHRVRDGRIPDRVYWENLPARPTTA